jgi:hypothetical protein
MKKLFLMFCLAGAATISFAQQEKGVTTPMPNPAAPPPAAAPAAPDPNAPDFKWESTTIDYGTVTKGDENAASREFKFTNVGKSPLIISNCHGSCGCTVPTCPTEPIQPGTKGTIKVHYDINRVGPFTKTVTVSSNAKSANEVLKISGTVTDPNAGKAAPAPATPPTPTPAPGK